MAATYNSFDVFLIAEQIERNGASFYRKAAERFDEEKLRDLFFHLAEWEGQHEKRFSEMKNKAAEEIDKERVFDPEDYMSSNPQVMAGLAAFAIRPDPASELSGQESRDEILKKALKKEEDTIVFYLGLKDFARDVDAKEKIDDIIKEEKRHSRMLKQSLEEL